MADRTVAVDVTVRLLLKIQEGVEVTDVINELDYNFKSTDERSQVVGEEITDHDVVDSK